MTTDRKLAWLGILIGLIGLFPLFHDSMKWGIVFLIVLILASGVLVWNELRNTKNALTIVEMKKQLEIKDSAGASAVLRRTQKTRVNVGLVNEIWFRNMVSDGRFGPISIDSNPPDSSTNLGCLFSYCKRFTPPLQKGMIRDVTLECEVYNSFPGKDEALIHEVAQETKVVILEVMLPQDRTCKTATLTLEAGGETSKVLDTPEISADRRTVTAKIKSPKTGYSYNLGWIW